jgi:hypothetical protein
VPAQADLRRGFGKKSAFPQGWVAQASGQGMARPGATGGLPAGAELHFGPGTGSELPVAVRL